MQPNRQEGQGSTFALAMPRIAVIGAGTMGRSIVTQVLQGAVTSADRLKVTDRIASIADTVARDLGLATVADNVAACSHSDVILLCVKPKDVTSVLEDLVTRDALLHRPLLVSIAAGVSTTTIGMLLQSDVPVVRAMPNTPCLIGRGVTVITPGANATDAHLMVAQQIFSTLGRCLTLEEKHFDAVTALSASGPAFIYVILEALTDGGVRCGLPREVATELAAQMTLGAADMVLTTGRHPASLKDDVTTPGGCTITGLLTLEDGRIRSVLARAIEATAHKAGELGR